MFDSMRRVYYWLHMAIEVYTPVRVCLKCVRSKPSEEGRRSLQLFLASDRLNFLAMDILELLPKKSNDNQFLLVMTDRYSKSWVAIPTCKTTAVHIVSTWTILYGISAYVLTESGTQPNNNFIESLAPFREQKSNDRALTPSEN